MFTTLGYSQEKEQKDYLKIGGAFRTNVATENYENSNNSLDTWVNIDTWFLSADARKDNFDLSFQYRFYPASKSHFIHHAYIGYALSDKWYAKAGVFQKPFGIGSYASNSWWLQLPYYLGLEDTYLTGVGASYKKDKLALDVAYFRQAAPKGPVSDNTTDNAVGNGRYSYAIVPTYGYTDGHLQDASIRELDQTNVRLRYYATEALELGASGQLGSIYNSALDDRTWNFSWALHSQINVGKFNIKAEIIGYDYSAKSNIGKTLDIIQMAAYGAAYDVTTQGTLYLTGISYKLPIEKKWLEYIQAYVDYTVLDKKGINANSYQLVPGVLLKSGPIYTYIDYAWGKNHPWLTSDFGSGLGRASSDARWNSRFNINIGYYF